MKKKLKVDGMADMRFENDEPFRPYSDTIEYESKKDASRKRNLNRNTQVSPDEKMARVPVTEKEKEKARLAEEFLKKWGI